MKNKIISMLSGIIWGIGATEGMALFVEGEKYKGIFSIVFGFVFLAIGFLTVQFSRDATHFSLARKPQITLKPELLEDGTFVVSMGFDSNVTLLTDDNRGKQKQEIIQGDTFNYKAKFWYRIESIDERIKIMLQAKGFQIE